MSNNYEKTQINLLLNLIIKNMFVVFFKTISQHSLEDTELYLTNKPSNLRGFLNFRPLIFQIINLNFYHNIKFLRMRQIFAVIFFPVTLTS
jgi:hypothetical protein